MHDCSKEFDKFYDNKVVLSQAEKHELWSSKRKNIKRLKDGLKKYNEENGTSYTVVEDLVQGSMEMHTVVQNDEKDYDIDVAIVFEEEDLEEKGPESTRTMVANVLKKETYQFSEDPEVKTGCVRLKYSTGYHIDFAIFKRYKYHKDHKDSEKYIYEHAGAEWSQRDIKALGDWFRDKNNESDGLLRKVVRLSKMFTRSREHWKNMPTGLVQTVVCQEEFATQYERIDEVFYYTMKNICSRLSYKLEVEAPADNGRALIYRQSDYRKMQNWRNGLEKELEKLAILFENNSHEDLVEAWGEFFNHDYWDDLSQDSINEQYDYSDTEEFIENIYPVNIMYDLEIDCIIDKKGFRRMSIYKFLNEYRIFRNWLPHGSEIRCSIKSTNCPSYDKVLWKVKNVGDVAKSKNMIRGQIQNRGKEIKESSSFFGSHYIECYLIKNDICVALDRIDVPIGDK